MARGLVEDERVDRPAEAALAQAAMVSEARPVRVSVVIPTRNRSDLLVDVLASLGGQTVGPEAYEIIVVDDGSTDDTAEQVARFSEQAPCRVVYHRLDRGRGPAHARNVGVSLARGQVIGFTDSDCRVEADWVGRGLAAIERGAAFATGSVLHKPDQPVKFFSGVNVTVTSEHPTYPTCNAFYRRDVYEQMGGMNESLCFTTFLNRATECADTDLAWRVRNAGHAHVFDPEMVIYHEVGLKRPWAWAVDPFRLFVVPLLVKRHPQLRRELLFGRVFFGGENALVYLTLTAVVLGLTVHPAVLAAGIVYPAWLGWVLRENLRPWRWPRLIAQIPLLMARRAVACAGLAYGSVRFRCVVL